jgi:hypothetical protein
MYPKPTSKIWRPFNRAENLIVSDWHDISNILSRQMLELFIFVEQSSTIECYCQPPPNLEMIAGKQACFIKQTNTFK